MTEDALIGHTGFVGSTLARARSFDARFNSSNIEEIRDHRFGTVVCAGVSAVKWLANKEPEQDRARIDRLVGCLERIEAKRFVLISTIDVYPTPVGVTEADAPDPAAAQPYGRHRRELELWARRRFENCTILRLPGVFGEGLKKNPIFDFLHRNQTEAISPNGVLQWYPMRRFAADLETVLASGLDLVNVAPAPVGTSEIHRRFFPDIPIGGADKAGPRYDMRTLHPELLGGLGGYHLDAETVMAELAAYIATVAA